MWFFSELIILILIFITFRNCIYYRMGCKCGDEVNFTVPVVALLLCSENDKSRYCFRRLTYVTSALTVSFFRCRILTGAFTNSV